jgi:hypothetical protein
MNVRNQPSALIMLSDRDQEWIGIDRNINCLFLQSGRSAGNRGGNGLPMIETL